MKLRRILSGLLVAGSVALGAATGLAYTLLPDRFAAFTVFPFWFWGGIGLGLAALAWFLRRSRTAAAAVALWIPCIPLGSDETRALLRFGRNAPQSGPAAAYRERPVLRVLTLNCSSFEHGDPTADIARWQPDIVLLQEVWSHQAARMAAQLYQGSGGFRSFRTNAIITRWHIEAQRHSQVHRHHQCTIVLPNCKRLEVANLHLASAATDMRLWHASAWRQHHANRANRSRELAEVVRLATQPLNGSVPPTLFGGDFNSGSADPIYRLIPADFNDAFRTAGTGWGDTFQRRVPILRIDRLFASRHLVPVRCRAVTTLHSDHRMVVADFLTEL